MSRLSEQVVLRVVSVTFIAAALPLGACDSEPVRGGVQAEVGGADVEGGDEDVSGAETSSDVGPTDVSVGEDGLGESDVTAGCAEGLRRCNGNDAEECRNGVYEVLFTCPAPQSCRDAACVVGPDPACEGRECGSDGAGGSCGTCTEGERCDASGRCVQECTPACAGRECGSDGCGGVCGTCADGEVCSGSGVCEAAGCTPSCSGRECGDDGCGGVCGTCGENEDCTSGRCVWNGCGCGSRVCGVDPCGNPCGTCTTGESCIEGACVVETLTCIGLIDCVYAETGCAAAETQEDFDVCVEGCYGRSIEASVMEFETYVSCLEGCPERDGDAATTDDDLVSDRCIYANCSDDQAACWFEGAGSGTCLGIFDCEDTCPEDDGSCLWQCYEAATPAAQAALMGLTNCADIECPEGSPETCVEDAIVGRCAIFAEMCLNN